MAHRHKICDLSLMFIVCCVVMCVLITFSSFNTGGNSIRFVRHRARREKRIPQIDSSVPNSRSRSFSTLVARVKRQVEASQEKRLFSPTESTRSTSTHKTIKRQSFPVENLGSQPARVAASGAYFNPAFSAFQSQVKTNGPRGPTCFRGNAPFYCAYIPCLPAVYQLPEPIDTTSPENTQEAASFKADCPVYSYRCTDGTSCISKSKWCDKIIDCPDASDEIKCSCRERIVKTQICDNYFDCPMGEDELGCFGCPENSFHCQGVLLDYRLRAENKSANCIRVEERCDGRKQCANGKDEEDCSVLSLAAPNDGSEVVIQMFRVGYSKGYLHRNLRGVWYPVCGYAYLWAREACVAELGDTGEWIHPEMSLRKEKVSGPYLTVSGDLVADCYNLITYVECPPIASGTRFASTADDALVGSSGLNASELASSADSLLGIVGGRTSLPRAWPFAVIVNKNGVFHCGGAVLSELWILTAAHCFANYQHHYYEVEAGVLRRSSYSATLQIRRIVGLKIHPYYDPRTMINDLALALLDEPLLFNSWVRPVLLPESETGIFERWPAPGTVCTAVGWGAMREGGPDPDQLREVQVPVINCVHPEDRNPAEICAGYNSGGRDACQGDSGGPLLCRVHESSSKYYVAGIISHGIGCARRNEPGVYTKVSYFVDWISNIMEQARSQEGLSQPRSACPGFKCNKPHPRCLPFKLRCDRTADCPGAEDEAGCSLVSSLLNRWLG